MMNFISSEVLKDFSNKVNIFISSFKEPTETNIATNLVYFPFLYSHSDSLITKKLKKVLNQTRV